MSYGSISREAHEAMAIAMNKIHGHAIREKVVKMLPDLFLVKMEQVFAVLSNRLLPRFGVTTEYLKLMQMKSKLR